MNDLPKSKAPWAGALQVDQGKSRNNASDPTASASTPQARPYIVVIEGGCRREWGRYPSREAADDAALKLRQFGFDAHVEPVTDVLAAAAARTSGGRS